MSASFRFSIVLSVQPAQFQAVAFKGELATNLAKIAGWGYDGVELAIRDPRLVHADRLCDLVGRHGLTVPAIGTGQAWSEEALSFADPSQDVRRAAIERVRLHVPLARRLNALIIIGLLRGDVRPGVCAGRARAWVVDALRECCDVAGQEGVRLALEPVNRCETSLVNTVAQAQEMLEAVAAPNLGLLFDTFHANIEEPSLEESLRAAGERLFHVHVADSNRWHPGAGHLDFALVLRVLQEMGYLGFVSGEFMPLPDSDAAAERGLRHLRCLGAYT